ncbi:MAG: hypothetical protein OEL88_11540 [Sterolibacteriaceae bacterium MAG5]|nr:hypothetical protein [Candidatus Nitricoxidireducens bremensis]
MRPAPKGEQRAEFRSFRLDCMGTVDQLDEGFENAGGRRLEDYLRIVAAS